MKARSKVTLRQAVPGDAAIVAEIWHLGWRDGHLGSVPEELMAARHEVSFRIRAEQRLTDTTVAEIEGQIAGFVMIVGNEVEQVYVSALHRGTGVADLLLREAERQIRDDGHSIAWLAVVAGNARARRFYQRNGWSGRGMFEYAAAGVNGPIPVPAHRYAKDL